MRKALVEFPGNNGSRVEVESRIITSEEDFNSYKELFPDYYPHVVELFKRELSEDNVIIVNGKGGWCVESEDIKIIKYLDAPNWTVEKKDEIETVFIDLITRMGMDLPKNFEVIVQDIYEDVCETADPDNWSEGDVAIGFRRWIEAQGSGKVN